MTVYISFILKKIISFIRFHFTTENEAVPPFPVSSVNSSEPVLPTPDAFEPRSFQEAIASEEAHFWKASIEEEFASIKKNETWTLTELPQGRTVVKCRWVFKIKPGHGEVAQRYKTRLVAKGYTQRHGFDYHDTFSPVVKYASLRSVLALVASQDLEIIQLDVKTAFLYGSLHEEIYMEQPEGFVESGRESAVCRLNKCIYGLKQAPRVWNQKFNEFLIKFGLTRSTADPCVYHRRQEEEVTIVVTFVDDGLVCSNKKYSLINIFQYLQENFEMRSFSADRFLGLNIIRDREQRRLYLTQPHFITKTLERFNMAQGNPLSIPSDPGTRLTSQMSPSDEAQVKRMEAVPYREAVGCLMYITTTTRPEIAFAVGQVSKFCQSPGAAHWNAVKRIFSYLAGTINHGLCFGGGSPNISGYTDADYAGDKDNFRSTTGFIFMLHGGPVSWSSRRQTCTALSTTESEFVAACETSKEGVWLTRLMEDIRGVKSGPMPLYCDNEAAIRLVKNPEFHQRTKHIDVKYYFIRDQ